MKSTRDESVRNCGVSPRRSRMGRILLGTTALTAALISTAALAQDAADKKAADEVVVVTGIRKSLETASQIKRKADTFVDSITASDVSALPDASVAEALGRIPGVSVTRYSILPQYNTGGAGGASGDFPSAEGSGNLIRGLSFVRSEFNGRDQFTANGGRALDWASIPPELVGGVDVYKNASAELIEGGAGGTINLRTKAPFDSKGATLSVSVDGTYADLRKEWAPTYSVIASNRWKTSMGEFGLMGSYSHSELKSNINDWQVGAPVPKVNVGAVETQGPAKFVGVPVNNVIGTQTVFQLRHNEQDRTRDSYYLAAQWRNDTTSVLIKYINVENGTDTVEHTVEHLPDSGTPTNTVLSNITTRPYSGTVALCNIGFSGAGGCSQPVAIGQLMTAGRINAADQDGGAYGYGINTLGRGVVDKSKTEDFSINLKHNFSSKLHLNLDAQYTKATAEQTEIWGGGQTHFMVDEVADLDHGSVKFTMDPRGNQITSVKPGLAATAASTDTANLGVYWWLFNADNEQKGDGDLYALRGDIVYDFASDAWFKDVKFGARYSERNQTNDTANQNWAGVAPPWAGGGATPFSALPAGLTEIDDYKDFFRGGLVQGANTKFAYISRDYLLNYGKMAAFFQNNSGPTGLVRGAPWAPRVPMFPQDNHSEITEKTTNFYVQFDFDRDIGNGQSLQGNFGVRYAKTELESKGNQVFIPFANQSTCTVGTDVNGVVTTAYACTHDSPQEFLPGTATYLAGAANSINYSKGDEHVLPSFNVKWNLTSDMLIRFGASKNLTRPNIADLRAYTTYGANTTTVNWPVGHCTTLGLPETPRCNDGFQSVTLNAISAGGGNPRLRPTTSDNFDLSYEWYFPSGNISTAVFTKKLKDVIQGGSETIGSVTLDGKTVPITYGGQVNSKKVDVSGVEFAYQQFYDFLPGIFSHLGAQANFTMIDASTTPDLSCTNNGETCRYNITDLFGQSKYLANLVGIYQDDKFEARLAYSWRSRYLIVKGDYMTGNPTYNQPTGFLDGSLKYNLNKHLQIHTSIENMLDTTTKAVMQVDAAGATLPRFAIKNDRRIVVGFRYLY